MNFQFSYSLELYFRSYDLWSATSSSDSVRHAMIGYSYKIPGICGPMGYSVLEFDGFLEIQNGAHELGHMFVFHLYL